MNKIKIKGRLIGKKLFDAQQDFLHADIVHIQHEYRPNGPAQNSIVIIYNFKDGSLFANYIPWVGYFDLDRAIHKDAKAWEIIEPSTDYENLNVNWKPFI